MDALRIPPPAEQLSVLTAGAVQIHPIDDLEQRLAVSHRDQRPLKIKAGFDPTAPDLHLGHTVLIEKMAQFQRFGHEVIFLVGDYTARIGDPTGRNAARPPLSAEQIEENASTYVEQCYKILDRERTVLSWNSRWLGKMSFTDVIVLASKYNLGRMLERRDFRQRFDDEQQICLHELLYPLMQGYDSLALEADVELGGRDQIFNLNVGRHVMEAYAAKPQIVLTVDLLVGLDGVDKMSKSKGNHVGILDAPDDMFGKIMSISDETLWSWIPLLTGRTVDRSTANPLAEKKQLAQEMVARFHNREEAADTRQWWDSGRPPRRLESVEVVSGPLFKVVHAAGAATSGVDARRKIQQGTVSLDGTRMTDPVAAVREGTYVMRVGKKWSAQVVVRC